MSNLLGPLVGGLCEVGSLVVYGIPRAWDMWGNLVYRIVEGKPYTGGYEVEDTDKIEYTFLPLEDLEIKSQIDYEYKEGDKEGLKACVGYNVDNNEPVWVDMHESHLMVAGASRWGKSNMLNVLLTSLMMSYTPNEVRFVLCDYKNADLKQFEKYKHCLGHVATDKTSFLKQIEWLEKEMNKRAEKLAKADCLNAINYNRTHTVDKVTYILFVIDELVQVACDTRCKEKLHLIMSKSASYGIYFILASQDCTKDTIGRCKMNVSHTIGFHTRDKSDSDMIIKNGNLEGIKVKGRAKYDCGNLVEFQSFYITEEQIKALLKPLLKEDK